MGLPTRKATILRPPKTTKWMLTTLEAQLVGVQEVWNSLVEIGVEADIASLGLRQQPPQRVLFQPELSIRQSRQASAQNNSPQPSNPQMTQQGYTQAGNTGANPSTYSIANYEPRPQMPLSLRPIVTPGNNQQLFQAQVKKLRDAKLASLGLTPTTSVMKPGAGFDGPNIYVRILNCLRCPIPEEQDYALHHMVKISHERGDKYRFDSFPGLAEGLIDRLLKISSLYYDVEWQVSYSQEDHDPEVLDGIYGTPDILERIQGLRRIDPPDELQSAEVAHSINKILEAGLTLRNLSMLEDNAIYLSEMAQLRDFLSIALNLPSSPCTIELKHYALDIAEQVTRYWRMSASDPLYQSLLNLIDQGSDRGAIITALRTICRISMNLRDSNLLPSIPVSTLRRISEWLVLEDEEFTSACLDFLYQFTAIPTNVLTLFDNSTVVQLPSLTQQLSRLLQFRSSPATSRIQTSQAVPATPATEVPGVPKDLMEQFLRVEEPERSKKWLKAVFEEDPSSHITQIALWQAYQQRFVDYASSGALLQAADFIKNVSNVFQGANAQVITGPSQRFIIKGIRPRHVPVDSKDRPYTRCLWSSPGSKPCEEFQLKPRHMFEHIARQHLHLQRAADGTWSNEANGVSAPRDCHWADCLRFERRGAGNPPTAHEIALHVKTHLPDVTTKSAFRQKHNRTQQTQTIPVRLLESDDLPVPPADPIHGREATFKALVYHNTAVDEFGNASGIPLTSALVLRNLARNTPKAIALTDQADRDALRLQIMHQLFGPIVDRLMFVLAHNKSLAPYATDVLGLVEKGMAES